MGKVQYEEKFHDQFVMINCTYDQLRCEELGVRNCPRAQLCYDKTSDHLDTHHTPPRKL